MNVYLFLLMLVFWIFYYKKIHYISSLRNKYLVPVYYISKTHCRFFPMDQCYGRIFVLFLLFIVLSVLRFMDSDYLPLVSSNSSYFITVYYPIFSNVISFVTVPSNENIMLPSCCFVLVRQNIDV